MTVRELLKFADKKLANSTSAQLDAEVLLSHVLDESKEYFFANPDHELTAKQEKQFKILLARRILGQPVAYLTKKKEFYGLEFYVDKNVLIPRPETEGLVEFILDQLNQPLFVRSHKKGLKIFDLGTGSGCIIISLAKNFPDGKFFASDLSSKALTVAKKNSKTHKVSITFRKGSLLEPWKNQNFDVIVANLPYLARETDPSTKFEPKKALVAPNKGLKIYEELFKQVSRLQPAAYNLFLEIGQDQGRPIKILAKKYLPGFKVEIRKDLHGKTRYAILAKLS